jgi:hypothetical protein
LLQPIDTQFTSDILHSNGNKKYILAEKCFYHENGIKAYDSASKRLFYEDGELAYNHITKRVYYFNSHLAYDFSSRKAYYSDSAEITNSGTVMDTCIEIHTEGKYASFKLQLGRHFDARVLVSDDQIVFNLFSDGKCIEAQE